MKIKVAGFILFSFISVLLRAQCTLNKLPLESQTGDYSFIVSGHFHGSSANQSTFPAATILNGIDTLNALKPAFLISLGDMFVDVNETTIEHYTTSLFNKLKMPLLNAVGNHDVSNGNMYKAHYGKSVCIFPCKKQLFIVLNTEQDDGNIRGDQLDLLKSTLADVATPYFDQFFVFTHRPVWAEGNPRYANLFKDNTQSKLGKPNFENEILPLFQHLKKPVYWFSGSMGGGPSSFFYDRNEKDGITYIQTAIRDTPRDAVLQVQIKNGNIFFKGISLTGQKLEPIETYNIDYWKENTAPEEKFNYRLLPYLAWLTVTHRYFWIGLATGIILLFFLTALIKKWRRKK